eukprot:361234-Prymnesium_polylepis.2
MKRGRRGHAPTLSRTDHVLDRDGGGSDGPLAHEPDVAATARTPAPSPHELDVRAVGPHLGRCLAIPAPAQDVLARLQGLWDLDHIPDGPQVAAALAAVARRREGGLPVPVVVAARAVGARGARAGLARTLDQALLPRLARVGRRGRVVGAGDAARAEGRRRHRDHRPHRARRVRALGDERALHRHPRVALPLEDDALLVGHKVEWGALEAGLGQRLVRRAQTILVTAAVVVLELPSHLRHTADLPLDAGRVERRELGAVHAVVRVLGRGVVARLGDFLRPRRPARKATRVSHRRRAGCRPRIVLVDVLLRARGRVAVDGPILGIDGASLARLAQVDLAATAEVVTLRAADEAALRIPERGLAVVARTARDIGAVAITRPAVAQGSEHLTRSLESG